MNQSMWEERETHTKRILGIITDIIYREDSIKFLW